MGNGKSLLFWYFNWLFPFPLYNFVPENKRDQLDGSLTVDHFFDNGYWLYQKLAEILPEDLVKRIVSIPLPLEPSEDQYSFGGLPKSNGVLQSNQRLGSKMRDTKTARSVKENVDFEAAP